MKKFIRKEFIEGEFWSFTNEALPDEPYPWIDMLSFKADGKCVETSKELFDLLDFSSSVTTDMEYLLDNPNMISSIIAGTSKKLPMRKITVDASGIIYFYFSTSIFRFGDRVPFKMEKCPSFSITIDEETKKSIKIEGTAQGTKISECAYGKKTRTFTTGVLNGMTIVTTTDEETYI